jgi:hypothetical protein
MLGNVHPDVQPKERLLCKHVDFSGTELNLVKKIEYRFHYGRHLKLLVHYNQWHMVLKLLLLLRLIINSSFSVKCGLNIYCRSANVRDCFNFANLASGKNLPT